MFRLPPAFPSSILLAISIGFGIPTTSLAAPEEYNVVWTSQSSHSGDSMPCVGGDIGLNVWVENNELMFYIGRAGCRDENGSLLKMGRVRIAIDPSPFATDSGFSQELKLREGHIEVRSDRPGVNSAIIRVWVETGRPMIHTEIHTTENSHVQATYENWRHERIELPNTAKNLHRGQCLINFDDYPGNVYVEPDDFNNEPHSIRFWHRMREDRNVFHHLVRSQGLEPIKPKLDDPCRNLTFGGELSGTSWDNAGTTPFIFQGETTGEYALTPFKGWRYQSGRKAGNHRIDIVTLIDRSESLYEWHRMLNREVEGIEPEDLENARRETRDWWLDFWNRSYIHINPGMDDSDAGWRLGRNYALFRYMLASGLHASEPIMFNGGVLTFDPMFADKRFNGRGYTPDHRQWGSALTAQNQRCMYWPMLKSGDLDLIVPGFDFYRNGLPTARERVHHYWGHDGCAFNEQITIQWLPGAMVYGYGGDKFKGKTGRYRPDDIEPGVEASHAVRHLYEGQLEWAWMILEYHRFTGSDITPYLPFIEQAVIFYDEHYRMREKQRTGRELTADGKLNISPSNTLEGHVDATNPTSVIAGLRQVLTRLAHLTSDKEKKQRWQGIFATLPEMPTASVDGRKVLLPTANHKSFSWHMPAMYPLYPYQVYSLGRPGIELMRDTFLHGIGSNQRMDHRAWTQGLVHYAQLGMSSEARDLLLEKLGNGPYRFPAFWPPAIDHAPDHNWGGMAMIGLQEMLMQTADERILLLPAWPQDWKVDFKLHAPANTLVEARVADGQVQHVRVSPREREKDLVVWKSPTGE